MTASQNLTSNKNKSPKIQKSSPLSFIQCEQRIGKPAPLKITRVRHPEARCSRMNIPNWENVPLTNNSDGATPQNGDPRHLQQALGSLDLL
jgi:hypothetical protein